MNFSRTVSRASKIASCAIAMTAFAVSSVDAQVIINDSFADGITNNGAGQIGFNVTSSDDALDVDQAGGPLDFASGNDGRTIHGLFPVQTLAEFGDALTVTFEFTTPDTIAFDENDAGIAGPSFNEDFRFGLFDTSQTTLANGNVVDVNTSAEIDFTGPINTSSMMQNPALNPLAGFYGEIDNINAPGTDLGIRTNNVNGSGATSAQSGQFLNTTTGFDQVGGGENDIINLVPNTDYVGTIQIAYANSSLTSFSITVGVQAADGTFVDSFTDIVSIADTADEVGVNTTSFNLLAFHATSGAFGGTDGPTLGSSSTGEANNGIDISNITITFDAAEELPANTIIDDDFADGITSQAPGQIGFNVTSSNSALNLGQAPGPLDFATGNSGRTIHGLFPAQTLTEFGDVLTLTFEYTTPDTIAFDDAAPSTNEDFRFGLFDTSQTTLANGNVADVNTGMEIDFTGPINTSSGSPNAALNPLAGFYGEVDNINAPDTDLGIRTNNVNGMTIVNEAGETVVAPQTGQFLNSTTGFDFISSGEVGVTTLAPNTNYIGTLRVEFTDESLTSLDITVGMATADAAAPGAFDDILTDTVLIADDPGVEVGVNTTTFDLLAFHATSGAFGGTDGPAPGSSSTGEANNGVDISSIMITFASANDLLIGDTNLDGIVNFLDISPFISILSGGAGFDPQAIANADINQSGEVNFLDISPFINALANAGAP